MKKTMLFLAAFSMTVAANARILRVSNVTGSSAPYTSIDAAHDAASAGDTIMVDGSSAKYGGTNGKYDITKKLVIIGPGYWLVENDVIAEGSSSASVATLNLKTTGIVVCHLFLVISPIAIRQLDFLYRIVLTIEFFEDVDQFICD